MSGRLAPGSAEWLSLVTASKIAPILGLSPYTDQYTQWHRMAGHLPPEEVTEAMRRGTFHESAILREFYYRHPDIKPIRGSGNTIRATEWLAVTPDSIARRWKRRLLVEVKTCDRWDHWGQPGTDEIPEHYMAQVIVCAHIAKANDIIVPVMGPFWDYREYIVAPDPELAEAILETCYQFWLTVQSGAEPDLSQTVSAYNTWTKVTDPSAGEGDVPIPVELAHRFLTAIDGEKDVKPAKAAIVNILEAAGAKVATCQGQKVAQRQRGAHGATLVAARKLPTLNLEEAS